MCVVLIFCTASCRLSEDRFGARILYCGPVCFVMTVEVL